jgi:hypothetical protein
MAKNNINSMYENMDRNTAEDNGDYDLTVTLDSMLATATAERIDHDADLNNDGGADGHAWYFYKFTLNADLAGTPCQTFEGDIVLLVPKISGIQSATSAADAIYNAVNSPKTWFLQTDSHSLALTGTATNNGSVTAAASGVCKLSSSSNEFALGPHGITSVLNTGVGITNADPSLCDATIYATSPASDQL